MRSVRLLAIGDDYDNKPGLVLKAQPRFDGLMAARDGLLIAHDILEHQNGPANIGAVWDELEALGGIWQVRGRWGDMMQTDRRIGSAYTPAQNIASNVTRMFSDWLSTDNTYQGPGSRKLGIREIDDEDFIQEVIAIATRDIPKEHTDMGRGDRDEDANGWDADMHKQFPEYLALAARRMRIGYRKAHKRYGHTPRATCLFANIRDAVNDAVKHIEVEGQEFVLSYSYDEARVREVGGGGAVQ